LRHLTPFTTTTKEISMFHIPAHKNVKHPAGQTNPAK
jgi:hypothetical protein